MSSLVPFVRRWGWLCLGIALALVLSGTLVLAASGSAHPSSSAGTGAPSAATHTASSASSSHSPTATPSVRTASPTARPSGSLALTCTAHRSSGEGEDGGDDDSVKLALACTVTGMPHSDTSFSLSFGVLDPLGQVHAFSQACAGTLHNGGGSCHQTYIFVLPFPAPPAPVTGQSLPSRHRLGPVTPTED